MNHDITHCYGCNISIDGHKIVPDESRPCPERDNCLRYKAHLEAKEQGLTFVTYRLGSVADCKIKWPIKKGGEE